MKEKTCCFTGHRLLPKAEIPIIKTELKKAIIELMNCPKLCRQYKKAPKW